MKRLIQALGVAAVLFAAPAYAEPEITILGEFNERPGNPAVGPDGTLYFSVHPFDQPEFKVMQLVGSEGVPFPTPEISRSFAAVIGIQVEQDGTVWILDMGSEETSPKLLGWDAQNNILKAVHYLPDEVSVANSFHQDFAIDEVRRKAFIADMSRGGVIDDSNPAMVVVDLDTGQARRVLEGHESLQPQAGQTMIAEGKPLTFTDEQGNSYPVELGLNPIAIDAQNEWVYFSTVHPGTLYRIPAETLGNFAMDDAELAAAIEPFAEKPSSDGIAADGVGQVYITNVAKNAISIADETGTRIWIQDDRLVWPDGVYVAPDGSVVATINQLNRAAPFNEGTPGGEPPFLIIRVQE
ncbi:MAG: L-dopachrome tautomerase-related protein [Cyanobacteria bacterium J06636_16]